MRWREIVEAPAAEVSTIRRRRDRRRDRELLLGRQQPSMAITAGKAMAKVETATSTPVARARGCPSQP